MSINQLPIELLQQIFSCLSYHELQQTSLVCHRWNEASETLVNRKVIFNVTQSSPESDECDEQCRMNSMKTIRNSMRHYQAISIDGFKTVDNWQQLEPIVAECVRRFPTVREVYLNEFLSWDLHCLYTTYREWIEQCSLIHVSLRNCSRSSSNNVDRVEWTLNMPNLKRLTWRECDYDPLRTVTIDAPNLETIYLSGGEDFFPGKVQLRCPRIKQVNCEPHESDFANMFAAGLENVEILQLTFDNRTDLGFLQELHQLKELQITLHCKMKSLDELVEMCAGLPIRTLNITSSIERSSLNMQELCENLSELQSLTLRRTHVFAEHEIKARQLEEFNWRHNYYYEQLTLNAPKLKYLTLDFDKADKLNCIRSPSLSDVCLYWSFDSSERSPEQLVYSFLDRHGTVTNLKLINDYLSTAAAILDKSTKVMLNLRKLELLRFTVTIDFFRMISESEMLQDLTIADCAIDCTGLADEEHIRLTSVDRIVLIGQENELKNSKRTDFPLLAGGPTKD